MMCNLFVFLLTLQTISCSQGLLKAVLNANLCKRLLKDKNLRLQHLNHIDKKGQTILLGILNDPAFNKRDEVRMQLMEKFIEMNVDLNVQSRSKGYTALHTAVLLHLPRIVHCLLEHGAPLETKTWNSYTALHLAVCRATNDDDSRAILGILLRKGANPNAEAKTLTPLHFTARNSDADTAAALLAYGADVNAVYKSQTRSFTALKIILLTRKEPFKKSALQKRCVVTYVNYGADMDAEEAGNALRRFWPKVHEKARMYIFDEEYSIAGELTAVTNRRLGVAANELAVGLKLKDSKMEMKELSTGLKDITTGVKDLALLYDQGGMFALYRILGIIRASINPRIVSDLEVRMLAIVDEMKSDDSIDLLHWEMRRLSWNVAVASIVLNVRFELAVKIAKDLVIPKNL